jgi:hypothetical protein
VGVSQFLWDRFLKCRGVVSSYNSHLFLTQRVLHDDSTAVAALLVCCEFGPHIAISIMFLLTLYNEGVGKMFLLLTDTCYLANTLLIVHQSSVFRVVYELMDQWQLSDEIINLYKSGESASETLSTVTGEQRTPHHM